MFGCVKIMNSNKINKIIDYILTFEIAVLCMLIGIMVSSPMGISPP